MSKRLLLPVFWIAWLWNFSYRMMFTAIMPALQQSMQLSNEAVGLLVGVLSLGYGAMSYPSSLASGKLDERWIICGGVALTTIAFLAFSISQSFVALLALSFVAGAGLSTYLPQGLSLLSRGYPTNQLGSVMGIHETAAPVGQMLGPMFVWFFITAIGWSGCLQAWSLFSLAVCILVLLVVPKSKIVVGTSRRLETARSFSPSLFPAMVVVQSTVWACNLGLLSMIPVYLTKTFLLDVSYVAFLLGVSRMTGPIGQLSGGFLSDRLGRTRVLLFVTTMVFAATLWITLIPFNSIFVAGLFIQGVVSSAFFPIFFATISDVTDHSNRARMIGLTNSVAGIFGGTVTPFVIGFLSDQFNFQIAFLFPIAAGIVALLGALCIWMATKPERR
jgi:MFS family permease